MPLVVYDCAGTRNEIASLGQTWAQTSHPVHMEGSITASGRW